LVQDQHPEGATTVTQYVGLDVSMKETKLHVLDDAGKRVWRGRCATEPATIAAAVRQYAPTAVRVGLETGPLTTWLWTEHTAKGLPMVCLDARHAKKALDMKVNKTDANDAEGIAHLVRAGWYREVRVKGRNAMLAVRQDRAKGSGWPIRKARSCPDNRRQRDCRGHHATSSSTASGA
jgi:transposase